MAPQRDRSDLRGLEALALEQGGYFDRSDALAHGVGDRLLHYHVKTGRFERVFPGVYRLHVAPIAPNDDLLLAWVWSNYRGVISHESALALYGLSDVMPCQVQLTVPPEFRRSPGPYRLYRSRLGDTERTVYEGLPVTTPARTIVDAAADGTDPTQVRNAVRQALDRALVSAEQLTAAARRSAYRHRRLVLPLIEAAIADAAA